MLRLAIVLTHNKGDKANSDQISTLRSLLTDVPVEFDEFDEEGNVIGQFIKIHHEIGLPFPHEVRVYQVIPFGVTPPPNRSEINSGGMVYYGAGDEDKTGDHPRFFNWGLKRATDNGAEVVIHLSDETKLDVQQLATDLQASAKESKEYGVISPKDTPQISEVKNG